MTPFLSKKTNSPNIELYFVAEESKSSRYNASSKARRDNEKILEANAVKRLRVRNRPGVFKKKVLKPLQLLSYSVNAFIFSHALAKISKNSMVFVQYPIENNTFMLDKIIRHYQKKGMRFTALVQDMDSLRYDIKSQGKYVYNRALFNDQKVLPLFDFIVSHNSSMSRKIEENGVSSGKIINLEVFDYLAKPQATKRHNSGDGVVFAGNLSISKSGFLYSLPEGIGKNLKIYGEGFEKEGRCVAQYKGSFLPEDVVDVLEGSFGLVWDGDSYQSCSGKFGEYLKYNNPHKTSMYLACGLPVIVWNKAAIAEFVTKFNIGYTIATLEDIPKLLETVKKKDYIDKLKNVSKIQKQLIEGHYLTEAIKRVRSKLGEGC